MIFTPLPLAGAWLIEPERLEDERGFFARTFCCQGFAARGLNPDLAQCSISYNSKKGTLCGMHFQVSPHAEAKLVRLSNPILSDRDKGYPDFVFKEDLHVSRT